MQDNSVNTDLQRMLMQRQVAANPSAMGAAGAMGQAGPFAGTGTFAPKPIEGPIDAGAPPMGGAGGQDSGIVNTPVPDSALYKPAAGTGDMAGVGPAFSGMANVMGGSLGAKMPSAAPIAKGGGLGSAVGGFGRMLGFGGQQASSGQLLPGKDDRQIAENIRTLKNLGLSEEDAVRQATGGFQALIGAAFGRR